MDAEMEQAVRAAIGQAARESRDFSHDRLEELGWEELLAEDAAVAVRVLFEEHGRHLLASPALDSVVHGVLRGPWTWTTARIAYPLPGSDGAVDGADIDGLMVAGIDEGVKHVLAPVPSEGEMRLHVLAATDVQAEPVGGLDPDLSLWRVTASRGSAREADGVVGAWPEALAAARRALAHELVGLSRTMMSIVVEHVSTRHQFGRPLGANQAVAHRLADAQVDLTAAELLAEESWATPTAFAAAAAKAQADRAFESIGGGGQQVLGAIGYTWEHSWHRYLRRGLALSALLGSVDECEREVGRRLLDTGIPRLGGRP
jgi:hypothetical protein